MTAPTDHPTVTQTGKPTPVEMIRAISREEQLVAAGSVVVVVSMFLTWKSAGAAGVGGSSVDGLHSWGLLTLLIALLAAAYVVARSPFFRNIVTAPRLPVTDAVAFIIAGAAEIVTAVLMSGHYPGFQTKLGFYVALIGGAATAGGGYLMIRARASTPTPAAPAEVEGVGGPEGLGGPPSEPTLGGPPTEPQ